MRGGGELKRGQTPKKKKKKKLQQTMYMLYVPLITQIHLVLTHYNSVGPISQTPCKSSIVKIKDILVPSIHVSLAAAVFRALGEQEARHGVGWVLQRKRSPLSCHSLAVGNSNLVQQPFVH